MELLLFLPAVIIALITYLLTVPLLRTIKELKQAGQGNWYHLSRWVQIIWMFGGILAMAFLVSALTT